MEAYDIEILDGTHCGHVRFSKSNGITEGFHNKMEMGRGVPMGIETLKIK